MQSDGKEKMEMVSQMQVRDSISRVEAVMTDDVAPEAIVITTKDRKFKFSGSTEPTPGFWIYNFK